MITKERVEMMDFIWDPVKTKVLFIFREPPLSYVENVYTLPFDIKVWKLFGALLLIVAVFFYFIAKWENKIIDGKHDNTILRPSITDIILLEIGAVCQQGAEVESKTVSGRILTIFIFILITFLYTAYAAFIVVLFQSTSNSIKDVKDLLTTDIKLGVQNEPYSYYIFEVSLLSSYQTK